jgi:hypothetical protein
MASSSAHVAIKWIDPLLVDCVAVTDLLSKIDGWDQDISPKHDLWRFLPELERGLIQALKEVLSREDPYRRPFRGVEGEYFPCVLKGCSSAVSVALSKLRESQNKNVDTTVSWPETVFLLESHTKNLNKLLTMLYR